MMKTKATQTKSTIGVKQNMRGTLRTLGLRKTSQSVVRESTGIAPGVVRTVRYLVTVGEVD